MNSLGQEHDNKGCQNHKRPRTAADFLDFVNVVLNYTNYPEAFEKAENGHKNRSNRHKEGKKISPFRKKHFSEKWCHNEERNVVKMESPLNSIGESARGSTRSSASSSESLDVDPAEADSWSMVTCWCGKPFAGRPMIECESCFIWLHLSCARVRKNKIPKHFKCAVCKPPQRRKRQSSGSVKEERKKKKTIKSGESPHLDSINRLYESENEGLNLSFSGRTQVKEDYDEEFKNFDHHNKTTASLENNLPEDGGYFEKPFDAESYNSDEAYHHGKTKPSSFNPFNFPNDDSDNEQLERGSSHLKNGVENINGHTKSYTMFPYVNRDPVSNHKLKDEDFGESRIYDSSLPSHNSGNERNTPSSHTPEGSNSEDSFGLGSSDTMKLDRNDVSGNTNFLGQHPMMENQKSLASGM